MVFLRGRNASQATHVFVFISVYISTENQSIYLLSSYHDDVKMTESGMPTWDYLDYTK